MVSNGVKFIINLHILNYNFDLFIEKELFSLQSSNVIVFEYLYNYRANSWKLSINIYVQWKWVCLTLYLDA